MARLRDEKEHSLTVLGEKTSFKGVLKFSDELHIAGKFEGAITAKGTLVIKKKAQCVVDYISAASIVVEGSVHGNMTAGDRIELRTGCSVAGNMTTSRLRIADGVSFEGDVEMIRTNSDIDLFSSRPEILKKSVSEKYDT